MFYKLIGILLSIVVCVSFSGCSKGTEVKKETTKATSTIEAFNNSIITETTTSGDSKSESESELESESQTEISKEVPINIVHNFLDETIWVLNDSASYVGKDGTVYHLYFHPEADAIKSNEHLTVVTHEHSSEGKDFDTYKEILMLQLNQSGCIVSENDTSLINGYSAWTLRYEGVITDTQAKYYSYMISVNRDNVIYSVVYTYSENTEEKESAVVQFLKVLLDDVIE